MFSFTNRLKIHQEVMIVDPGASRSSLSSKFAMGEICEIKSFGLDGVYVSLTEYPGEFFVERRFKDFKILKLRLKNFF